MSEEEKERLKEKWKKEIAAIEEDAKRIRNGESTTEASSTDKAVTKNTIDDTEHNSAEKDQKVEHDPKVEANQRKETNQGIRTAALGLIAMAGVFFGVFHFLRKRPVLREENYTDIHSHILPGVDDGAKNMEETLAMLRTAKKQGIRTIIATPHYKVGQHKKTAEELEQIKEMVQLEADEAGLDMEILLGNELYYNRELCERLDKGLALTLADTRYVLVEFSVFSDYTELYQGLRNLIQGGYIPILAHMERYECLRKDKDKIKELISLGIYMQMNTESLKRHANKKLVKEGYIHFFGSDSHNTDNRKPNMQDGINELGKSVSREQLEQILVGNPKKLREDKYLL